MYDTLFCTLNRKTKQMNTLIHSLKHEIGLNKVSIVENNYTSRY